MPLKLLIDEDVRALADAIREFSHAANLEVDVVAVGDGDGPPPGTKDIPLLAWAEQNDRVIVTRDRSTLQRWLSERLRNGGTSPGAFILKLDAAYADILG